MKENFIDGKSSKDSKHMVKEEGAPAAANAVAHGGVDMTPGKKQQMMKKKVLKRFKDYMKEK